MRHLVRVRGRIMVRGRGRGRVRVRVRGRGRDRRDDRLLLLEGQGAVEWAEAGAAAGRQHLDQPRLYVTDLALSWQG